MQMQSTGGIRAAHHQSPRLRRRQPPAARWRLGRRLVRRRCAARGARGAAAWPRARPPARPAWPPLLSAAAAARTRAPNASPLPPISVSLDHATIISMSICRTSLSIPQHDVSTPLELKSSAATRACFLRTVYHHMHKCVRQSRSCTRHKKLSTSCCMPHASERMFLRSL